MTQAADPSVALPDWDAIAREITCPLCDYNLRGLSEARCPECGFQFAWLDLLSVDREPHPYVFEQRTGRNFWSFWITAVGGLRPRRFWKTLTPLQPSRPRRLVLYWMIAIVVGLIGPAMLWFQKTVDRAYGSPSAIYPRSIPIVNLLGTRYDSFWAIRFNTNDLLVKLDGIGLRFNVASVARLAAGVLVGWPLGTMLALMIFQASIRRARIKPIHVLRCVLYSSDAAIWFGIAALPMMALYVLLAAMGARAYQFSPIFIEVVLLAAWVVFFAYRLMVASRYYLQIRHAGAMVLATQTILVLVFLCIWLR